MPSLAIVTSALPAQAYSIAITYSLTAGGDRPECHRYNFDTHCASQRVRSLRRSEPQRGLESGDLLGLSRTGFRHRTAEWNFHAFVRQRPNIEWNSIRGQHTAKPTQRGPFYSKLEVYGWTGEFAAATRNVSGQGLVGASEFTLSGTGTINPSPVSELSSILFLPSRSALIIAGARRSRSQVRARAWRASA